MQKSTKVENCRPEADCLQAALAAHARGWSIIPIRAGTKKPTCKWTKYQTDRATEAQLTKWFGNGQDVGLAVVFGPVSGGLVCRDFDVQEAYDKWAAHHSDLASTLPTVATSRGRHVYFRAAETDLRFVDLPDGEYRGDSGHYCLLPPSRHPEGPEYRWLIPPPDSEMPFVADVHAAGLLPCYTEHTEDADNTAIVCSVDSVCSVSLCVTSDETPHDRVERMIRECLPTGPGRRNRQVFQLARAIKALPELAGANVDTLRPIVQRWHELALPRIKTKEFSECWIDFLRAWPRVKIPKGATMATIMEKALQAPMPRAATRYEDEPIRRLVALCKQLHVEGKGEPFFLSCRTAGQLLGVSHVQANRWLFLLAHDRVIEQINAGDRAKRQAAEYQYAGD